MMPEYKEEITIGGQACPMGAIIVLRTLRRLKTGDAVLVRGRGSSQLADIRKLAARIDLQLSTLDASEDTFCIMLKKTRNF